ncbi:MAG: efflux RND transporter permease subunit [Flavobacteriales bacterium]|nr:efflux RND transporter permease subunit [Flavobacteriales bacterium]
MSKLKSIVILFALTLVTVFCIVRVTHLRFDYDFEKFFPVGNEESDFYFDFRSKFETDNDFVIVGVVREKGVFNAEFLAKVDSLSTTLKQTENIVEVLSPTDLKEVVRDPALGFFIRKPVIDWENPESYPSDSAYIMSSDLYAGSFFSKDGKALAINMKHTQGLSKQDCDKVADDIQSIVNSFGFEETHIIGRSLGQKIYVEMMASEMTIFVTISFFLTLLFLFIAFRSFWNVAMPTLVVLTSIIWTLGAIELMGKDIDIMLTILPTILFVIGISDSVHILARYIELLRSGKEKVEAIKGSIRDTILPTFLTAITTSIGFGTLIFNGIEPISNFGLYTSLGVMMAFIISYAMIPAGLYLCPLPNISSPLSKNDFWTPKLHVAFLWVLRKRKRILWGALIFTATCIAITTQINVNNFMLEDLDNDHFLKQEFKFVEDKFSGARPFEMAIMLNNENDIWDIKVLTELDRFDSHLRKEYGVGNLFSLPMLIKTIHKAMNGGQSQYFSIPTDPEELEKIKKLAERKDFAQALNLMVNKEEKLIRFSGKVADLGRAHFDKVNSELEQLYKEMNVDAWNYKVTGTAHLIDYNNSYLVENMIWDIVLSILSVALLVGLLFYSFRIALLSLIPNIIPLIGLSAFMVVAGIDIKISTSIIFSIAFGIAVDDTIHFMGKLKLLQQRGYSKNYAVKRTFISTGKAIIMTSLILCAGFVSLIFSSFMGTFYVGLLVTITLIIALVGDLLLTSVLVMLFAKENKKYLEKSIEPRIAKTIQEE